METMIQQGTVTTETHAGITTIAFAHPQSNSMPSRQLEKLAQEIHFAGNHDETKVIILKSSGDRAFCSGASFDELMQIT
ncbi:MAG: enoyl-CoA hydratase-related protein [Ferruginibacter sp.]